MLAPILALVQIAYVPGDGWPIYSEEENFTSAMNSKIQDLSVQAYENNQILEVKDIQIFYKEGSAKPRGWIVYDFKDRSETEK